MGEQSNIDYNFTATDQLSPVLQAQAQSLQQLAASTTLMQQSLNGVLTLSQQLATGQQALTTAFNTSTQGINQSSQALQQLAQSQTQVATQASQTGSVLQTAFGVAGGLGIAISIRQIVSEMRDLVVESTRLAIQRESLVASFRGISGSAGGAREQLRFLREEATRTSSDFDTLATSYRNITAASRGTSLEGESTRTVFQGITEAGRVLGLSQAEVGRALLAVEQIISKGKVSQEELRRQLGNALPGAAQIAARAFGVTTEELNKMVASGISAEEFIARLGPQLRREFGPGLQQAAQTASATFARLGNEIRDISAGIGSEILDLLKPAASALDTFLRRTREAREREQVRSLVGAGGADPTATDDERAQLTRLGRVLRLNAGATGESAAALRQRIQAQIDQINEGIEARRNPGVSGDVPGGGFVGRGPFASQLDELKRARQEVEQELALAGSIERNAPALFAGAGGDVERAQARLTAIRAGLENIAGIVARTPGLAKELTPEFRAQFEELNKQYALQLRLQESAQARIEAERQAEREREQAARRAERDAALVARQREQAVEQLGRLAAQLRGDTREERAEDVAAAIQLRFPNDAQIQSQVEFVRELANEVAQRKAIVAELKNAFQAEQEADAIRGQAEATQARLNNAIQRAIELTQAPREERTETRLRALFRGAGVAPTADQDTQLTLVSELERRRAQAKQIEEVFRDLGRSVEQTFEQIFERIFSGGVTSARSFGLLVAQSLQQLFGRLAAQLATTLLNSLAGGTPGKEGSGIGGLLAGLATRLVAGILGGSVAGAGGAGGTPSGTGIDASGGAGGFGSTVTFAQGGIATRPTFALIGDNRSGFGEAVIPLSQNRAVPVEMRGSGRAGEQPIVLQVTLQQDFSGSIDPRSLRTTPPEIVSAVVRDITGDGVTRRVIMQHAR